MPFVKTFEEFKNTHFDNLAEAKQVVSQQDPESDEIARWKVVLKASKDEDSRIDDANATQDALDALTKYDPFIKWWTTEKHKMVGSSMGDTAQSTIPNSSSIAFADIGSHRQAGTLLKEKATITFIFKQLFTDDNNNFALVKFDTTKGKQLAAAKVRDSDVAVIVWNAERMDVMKLEHPKLAKDKEGKSIKIDQATAEKIVSLESNDSAVAQVDTTTQAPIVTTDTTTQASTVAQPAKIEASAFPDIPQSLKVNNTVKAIQQLIMEKGSDAAKKELGSSNPTDGKFWHGTERAISQVLDGNNTTKYPKITADVVNQLFAKLGVTQAEVTAIINKVTSTATSTNQNAQVVTLTRPPKPQNNPGF